MTERQGMSARTGEWISGIDHLSQSVADILLTAIGTRVERRDYGSMLPRRVDRPVDDALRIDLIGDIYDALRRWEPDLHVSKVTVAGQGERAVEITIEGRYRPSGQVVNLPLVTVI